MNGTTEWPVLGSAARYGLIGEIVSAIEPHTEADPAGLLTSLLVEFGALVGSKPHAIADSAEHPARLAVVLVGDTAKGRKGSAGANVARLVRAADPEFGKNRHMNGFGSGEALVDALRGSDDVPSDPRLVVTEPEFSRILSVATRDGSTLSAIIRQAWDGGQLAVRSRSGTTVAEESHVCIVAHISSDELRTKLTSTEIAGGFANRFLFVCVRRSKLLPSGGNLDDAVIEGFARKFALLASTARRIGILRRTPAAEVLWADLYQRMDQDSPGGLLASVIARDAAQVLRLSVTYALLDGSQLIDVVHLEAAWAVWSYCRDSAAHIFGESIGNQHADRLLTAARDAGDRGLDGREQNIVLHGHATKSQLDAARRLLLSKKLVTEETIKTDGRNRQVIRAVNCEQSEQSSLKEQRSPGSNSLLTHVRSEQSELSEQSHSFTDDPRGDWIDRLMAADDSALEGIAS